MNNLLYIAAVILTVIAVVNSMSMGRKTCSCSVTNGRGRDGNLDFNGFNFGDIAGYCGDSPPDDATDDECDHFVNNPTKRGGHRNRRSSNGDNNCYDYCRYRGGSDDDCVSCCSCCCGKGGLTYRGHSENCLATTTAPQPTKPTEAPPTEQGTKPTQPPPTEGGTKPTEAAETTTVPGDCKLISVVYFLVIQFYSFYRNNNDHPN